MKPREETVRRVCNPAWQLGRGHKEHEGNEGHEGREDRKRNRG
jgi:hypothetical protein